MSFFILISRNDSDKKNDPPSTPSPESECYVHLFDGENFTDDIIIVEGPGNFPNLENLPDADKNWSNEADSFKSGKNTIVTLWTDTNFEGDAIVFEKGTEEPSIDEPRSMKIRCSD